MINIRNWHDGSKWPKSHGLLTIPVGWRELNGEERTKQYTDFIWTGYEFEPICIIDWSNIPVSTLYKIGYKIVIRQISSFERSETDLKNANWQ